MLRTIKARPMAIVWTCIWNGEVIWERTSRHFQSNGSASLFWLSWHYVLPSKVTVWVLAISGLEGAAKKTLREILAMPKVSLRSPLRCNGATFLVDRVSIKYCTATAVFQLKLTLPKERTLAIPDVWSCLQRRYGPCKIEPPTLLPISSCDCDYIQNKDWCEPSSVFNSYIVILWLVAAKRASSQR